ncbi:MAG: phenylalanine--tRNA ligase subunit beta [Acidobacteria bacterium]|nr:phenylalanine--tRNA ligase subunit beta [Acidobacteriota bacterium]
MRALVSWLQDFVEIPESPAQLAAALTLAGMAVDTVETVDGEAVLELDITSNRPDAANHLGLAREIAAIFGRPLKRPKIELVEDVRPAADFARIEIDAEDLCARYVGRVLLGVEVKPSPDWLRRRLELCGTRSINNIADLTNYVLLECGHPTHAFDLNTLNDRRIVVRRAAAGEAMRTLDGLERKLTPEDLVIADAYHPVALAGIMGGLESEISDSTRDVLIEAAWFEPGPVRRTSRRLSLHTEASYRFARGADIEAAPWAADRIAALLGRLSPGAVLQGRLDVYPRRREALRVDLRADRFRRVIGVDLSVDSMRAVLERLDFHCFYAGGETLSVEIPSHRLDVEREIDLIEEVARVHGYDHVPSTLPTIGRPLRPAPHVAEEGLVRETLRALGYDETIGYAFQSAEEAEMFGAWPAIPLRNPFSELAAVMRTSSAPTMLQAIAHNVHRNETNVKLAELGRLYRRDHDDFSEPPVLTLGATGDVRPADLREPAKELDFYDLKADVEALLRRFDLAQIQFDDQDTPAHYIGGCSARVQTERGTVAYLGEVDPQITEKRKIRQPVFLAEIFLDKLYEAGLRRPQHRDLPKAPSVYRDFSLLVPEGIPFGEIRTAIGVMEHLISLEPMEIFRGKQVTEGHYSLLLRARWQQGDQTFTDEQVNAYAEQLTGALDRKLNIQLRG